MNLNQLKLFYLAVKRKNLSLAAAELNITQPAVTKGIQRLEQHYEVKLVHRLGKKMALTQAGDALYRLAEQIFELEKLAEQCLYEYQPAQMSHIRIHASESFGAYHLPGIINRFNRAHPAVKVTVDIVPNEQVLENTLGLENDLGCISHPVENKKLCVTEILEDELVIIVPPGHAFSAKNRLKPLDLEGQVMIMHEEGSIFQEFIHRLRAENNITLSMPITLSNNEAIKRAVEAGTGIALISRQVAREEIHSKKLIAIPLSGSNLVRKFYLIYHKDKYLSESVRRLVDMVIEPA
jgi:DNA-binding transcriptional LysR family regulator